MFWVAQSLVFAEEHQVTHLTASKVMPLVPVFGRDLQRAFRDAVHAVGAYDEVYLRHVESMWPRARTRN